MLNAGDEKCEREDRPFERLIARVKILKEGDRFVEFDSLINMRPSQGNKSRGVESEAMRKNIIAIIEQRIVR